MAVYATFIAGLHILIHISGICPGDKVVKSSEDPSTCVCPMGYIEGMDDKCFECGEGQIANENQTGCVGMLE